MSLKLVTSIANVDADTSAARRLLAAAGVVAALGTGLRSRSQPA